MQCVTKTFKNQTLAYNTSYIAVRKPEISTFPVSKSLHYAGKNHQENKLHSEIIM